MDKISSSMNVSSLILPGRPTSLTRRRFVEGLAAGTTVAALLSPFSARRVRAAGFKGAHGSPELSGTRFDLSVEPTRVDITGYPTTATLVNGQMPGPILRWREGDTVTLRVTNRLRVPTSIHWHGIYVPAGMDGVPGISFRGIAPGETFTYRFPVRQSGTYWYHSHSGFQEQTLLAGSLIIAPFDLWWPGRNRTTDTRIFSHSNSVQCVPRKAARQHNSLIRLSRLSRRVYHNPRITGALLQPYCNGTDSPAARRLETWPRSQPTPSAPPGPVRTAGCPMAVHGVPAGW